MAIMKPDQLPPDRRHLDREDRVRLLRFELLIGQNRFAEAQDAAEDLWLEATDAHKGLYRGLANAVTAVCARDARQRRGAEEIARRSRALLAPYPRHVLDIDLDALLDSVDRFVDRGEGSILLLRQG